MDAHYAPSFEPASPEYVLMVIHDMNRQQCQHDPEADPDVTLSFDSTVAEWRSACDLVDSYSLGRALNNIWDVNITDEEWQAVLEPPRKQRLANVCHLLYQHASRPVVRPGRLLGSECRTAGCFLTVRSIVGDAGASARDIKPSTPLAEYTRRYASAFLGPISHLAPGALPLVEIRTPAYYAALWGVFVGVTIFVIGWATEIPSVAILGGILLALAYMGHWIAARYILPSSVEFGSLSTFGELAAEIADHGPA